MMEDHETAKDDSSPQVPGVGIAVFAIRAVDEAGAGDFIIGKRQGSLGAGTNRVRRLSNY